MSVEIVGYETAEGPICTREACMALYADIIGEPIHAGDDACPEGRYLMCACCSTELDERAWLAFAMEAPVPWPAAMVERAIELGVVRRRVAA